jgi:Fe-S-cluster containining protein
MRSTAHSEEEPSPVPEAVTAHIKLSLSGRVVSAEIQVPTAPVSPLEFLPLFQQFTDAVMDIAVEDAAAHNQTVSCRKGCGACCRQLVPISEMEAHWIRDLLHAMPEARRTAVRARFDEARRRLNEAGLLEKLLQRETLKLEEITPLGEFYFDLGIPCPFLDDESCSIHRDRPLACREYLVSSPAENCAHPRPETIEKIEPFGKPSLIAARLGEETSAEFMPWVPLTLALEWAEDHPDSIPLRPGTEIMEEFFARLSAQNSPPMPTEEA